MFGKTSKRRGNEIVGLEHAFDKAFDIERSKDVYTKIGISPFTRKFLKNSHVAYELIILADGTIDLEADPSTVALIDMERKNHVAIKVLNDGGYDGEVFKKYARRKNVQQEVTIASTRARQDALSSVKYSSQHFILTSGDTLNSNDFFHFRRKTGPSDTHQRSIESKNEINSCLGIEWKSSGVD